MKRQPRRDSTVGIHQFAKHQGKGENLFTLGYLNLWWEGFNMLLLYDVNFYKRMMPNELKDEVESWELRKTSLGFELSF